MSKNNDDPKIIKMGVKEYLREIVFPKIKSIDDSQKEMGKTIISLDERLDNLPIQMEQIAGRTTQKIVTFTINNHIADKHVRHFPSTVTILKILGVSGSVGTFCYYLYLICQGEALGILGL